MTTSVRMPSRFNPRQPWSGATGQTDAWTECMDRTSATARRESPSRVSGRVPPSWGGEQCGTSTMRGRHRADDKRDRRRKEAPDATSRETRRRERRVVERGRERRDVEIGTRDCPDMMRHDGPWDARKYGTREHGCARRRQGHGAGVEWARGEAVHSVRKELRASATSKSASLLR